MSVAIIISAYQSAASLHKTLVAYSVQTLMPDEIIIAEDGESIEIAALIQKTKLIFKIPLIHLTQEDNGFRKNHILNKAINAATSRLLIFTDQDILPRKDFVAMHVQLCKPNQFISGGSHLNIQQNFHEDSLCDNDIINQNIFNPEFITENSSLNFSPTRLTNNAVWARILDFITPRNVFIGCNSSVYKKDVLEINGFDESMGYGGDDVNLGVRLNNIGCKGNRHKYSLVCLHLDHKRPYLNKIKIQQHKNYNKQIKLTKETKPKMSLFLNL